MVKCFKNGNMNCRFEKDKYYEKEGDLISLLWELEDYSCDLLGEEQCINNYEMGVFVYSWFTDMKYLINYSDLDAWHNGKTLKLIGRPVDEDDREWLKEEYES